MARRKRKEEETLWEPPVFDEVGYMRQEIQNAKIAVAVIAWAVVGAITAYLLALWIPVVGYLAGLAVFGALYFVLPALGLPIHGFKRRDWMSHASVYFFSWLAFSILLLNPPFGDHTSPVVGSFEVGTFNPNPPGNLTWPRDNSTYCVAAVNGGMVSLPGVQSNLTAYVHFRATDNVRVAAINVTVNSIPVTPTSVGGQWSACTSSPQPHRNFDGTYAIAFSLAAVSSWIVSVTAVDTSGLSTTESITIQS